ncbi:hypothetical protein BC829DRAFT_422478 [Chytridium lagenaria]|nr:hypothetical protein BC829DRAFT_422478 [Chytridium lagenaria]
MGELEELRYIDMISIIAKMASLKHYHMELEDLRRENTEIREIHQDTLREMVGGLSDTIINTLKNGKVSDILKENELAHIQILKLQRIEKETQALQEDLSNLKLTRRLIFQVIL